MKLLIALVAGSLFGFGLSLSGMTDPAKVIGFLDLGGHWDPTLAFVMGGGLLITFPAFAFARRRTQPWLDSKFDVPTRRHIDSRLLAGAACFGIGWGVAGFCPGPIVASLSSGAMPVLLFGAAMIGGMGLATALTRRAG